MLIVFHQQPYGLQSLLRELLLELILSILHGIDILLICQAVSSFEQFEALLADFISVVLRIGLLPMSLGHLSDHGQGLDRDKAVQVGQNWLLLVLQEFAAELLLEVSGEGEV